MDANDRNRRRAVIDHSTNSGSPAAATRLARPLSLAGPATIGERQSSRVIKPERLDQIGQARLDIGQES
jgi:hypothetical protein